MRPTAVTYETAPLYNIKNKNRKEDIVMTNLPKEIKLSPHAKQRLVERKNNNIYNIENLMQSSSIKWYGKDDIIRDSSLYKHCCYTTRQSKDVAFITDGEIEVLYDKNTKIGITILEVKDKFKPISQYLYTY